LHIVRVRTQTLLLQRQRSGNQTLNLLLDLRVGGTMRRGNKSVIRVLPSVQHTHAVKFPEESGGQEVIDGEGIVRMPSQYLVKFLHRAVIIEVVEMIERGQVEWIMWTVGQRFGNAGYLRRSHH